MHAAAPGVKGRYRIFLFVETAAAASQRGKLYQETISKSISSAENEKYAAETVRDAIYYIEFIQVYYYNIIYSQIVYYYNKIYSHIVYYTLY